MSKMGQMLNINTAIIALGFLIDFAAVSTCSSVIEKIGLSQFIRKSIPVIKR